jgi:hypothetical protein
MHDLQSAMTACLRMFRTTLDGDAEEVVKRPEVLYGEFSLKSENGTAQALRAGCGHDDIITNIPCLRHDGR